MRPRDVSARPAKVDLASSRRRTVMCALPNGVTAEYQGDSSSKTPGFIRNPQRLARVERREQQDGGRNIRNRHCRP